MPSTYSKLKRMFRRDRISVAHDWMERIKTINDDESLTESLKGVAIGRIAQDAAQSHGARAYTIHDDLVVQFRDRSGFIMHADRANGSARFVYGDEEYMKDFVKRRLAQDTA